MQLFIILIALLLLFEVHGKTYDGYNVIRFIPRTEKELIYLKKLQKFRGNELDFWLEPQNIGNPVDVLVSPVQLPEILQEAKVNFQEESFRNMIEDVGSLINNHEKKRSKRASEDFENVALADFDYSIYHTYEEINVWIDNIAKEYPDLASTFVVGTSYEGRNMNALKIGSKQGKTKRAFWLDGGIHSREWISPATVLYMVNAFLENYGKDDEVTRLLDEIDWFMLPVFNVDGYKYTWEEDRLWRKTRSNYFDFNLTSICIGVDPNRNWDFDWCGINGSSTDPCSIIYCGPEPFSESEVRAVAEYVNKSNPDTPDFDFFMNIHSYSQMILAPWSWTYDLPEDYDIHYELAERAAKALTAVHGTNYTYGSSSNVLYISSGASKDWAYGKGGITFSYTMELRDTGEYGFLLPEDQIMPTGEETLEAFKEAANYILEFYGIDDSSTQTTYNILIITYSVLFYIIICGL